jgi:hypothetical protein
MIKQLLTILCVPVACFGLSACTDGLYSSEYSYSSDSYSDPVPAVIAVDHEDYYHYRPHYRYHWWPRWDNPPNVVVHGGRYHHHASHGHYGPPSGGGSHGHYGPPSGGGSHGHYGPPSGGGSHGHYGPPSGGSASHGHYGPPSDDKDPATPTVFVH